MKLRPGWYAYRVAGAARLPSWAVEVALTMERPVDLGPEGSASGNERAARPWSPGPEGPDGATRAAQRSPSPASGLREGQGASPMEPDPPDPRQMGAQVQAMVLLRAPGTVSWLAGIAEVAAEVEAVAGVRPLGQVGTVGEADTLVDSVLGARTRLLTGPPLPGLVPISPAVAQVHLGTAGARGLPAPLRRWRPTTGPARVSWQAGVGSVMTCDGPCGLSAQAVVALRGLGNGDAITPPPGGALVLRAWRTSRTWGAACGLVLGAAAALGLGREARRVAAGARAAGWDAVVLEGPAALHLARAGDHRQAAPEAAAHAASGPQVAALFETFLTACGRGRPSSSLQPLHALAVTP
jgi:hypothetical protein